MGSRTRTHFVTGAKSYSVYGGHYFNESYVVCRKK